MSYIKPFTQPSNPSNSVFSSGFWVPNSEVYGQLIVAAARHWDCTVRTADLVWVLKIGLGLQKNVPEFTQSLIHSIIVNQKCASHHAK